MSGRYKVHKLDYKVMIDPNILETFLNSLNGEIISIISNVTSRAYTHSTVDFLLVVEKLSQSYNLMLRVVRVLRSKFDRVNVCRTQNSLR